MRRARNRFLGLLVFALIAANTRAAVELGIDVLEGNGYALLKGKRLGLITNQTGLDSHDVRTRVLLKKNVLGFKEQRSRYLLY
jgi:uncharacterized protein YbbC (DUF1343 family)